MSTTRPTPGQRLRNNWLELAVLAVVAAALLWIGLSARGVWKIVSATPTVPPAQTPAAVALPTPQPDVAATAELRDTFDGQLAADRAAELVAAGPRTLDSSGHTATVGNLIRTLRSNAWGLEQQSFTVDGVQHLNIIARSGSGDAIVVAAHYDSSPTSDLDADAADQPTPSPGANDGAGGAAILLELARALNKDKLAGQVWLAFLDGRYAATAAEGKSQAVDSGAKALAEALPDTVKAVVLVDLTGHPDQQFRIFANGDPQAAADLWAIAEELGYSRWFLPQGQEASESSLDPFTAAGIPATAISDPGYPYLRTSDDTIDKLAASGLERVGRVLEVYLERQEQ